MKTILVRAMNIAVVIFLALFFISCNAFKNKIIPKAYTVEIKGMKFIPATLNVNKGDTITWINHDLLVHDVTEAVNRSWSSSKMEAGTSWRLVISESANYFCSIHVVMTGKIIVQSGNDH